jgi:hypothetical protein
VEELPRHVREGGGGGTTHISTLESSDEAAVVQVTQHCSNILCTIKCIILFSMKIQQQIHVSSCVMMKIQHQTLFSKKIQLQINITLTSCMTDLELYLIQT